MKTGTCYFPSYGAAMRYYRPYAETPEPVLASPMLGGTWIPPARNDAVRALVDQKLNASEIHIGKPGLKPGETLSIEDNRYHITEATK